MKPIPGFYNPPAYVPVDIRDFSDFCVYPDSVEFDVEETWGYGGHETHHYSCTIQELENDDWHEKALTVYQNLLLKKQQDDQTKKQKTEELERQEYEKLKQKFENT